MNMSMQTFEDGVDRPVSRRSVLGGLAALAGGLWSANSVRAAVAPTLRAASALATDPRNFLVVLKLDGANDGLNTIVPRHLSQYFTRRPDLALNDAETLSLDNGPHATTHYRMMRTMPRLAGLWQDGHLAVVQKVGYPNPNFSHDASSAIWDAGQRQNVAEASGWIARYAAAQGLDAVGTISLGAEHPRALVGNVGSGLILRRLSAFRFWEDYDFRADHERRLSVLRELLDEQPERRGTSALVRDRMRDGHTLTARLAAARDGFVPQTTFPQTRLGRALIDVSAIVHAQLGTRVFYTQATGFDTHGQQGRAAGPHAWLLGGVDAAVGAFRDECEALGVWQHCVLCIVSEFGRRNAQNASLGTDHGAGNCVLVAGGAVHGGLHGESLVEADLEADNLPYSTDFRSIYRNVLERHLGLQDADAVFPESTQSSLPVAVV